MKNWRKFLFCIIITFSLLGIFKVFEKVKILTTVNHKNNNIKDYSKKLKRCFDLENKNQRRINESLDLIEYCMKEFGID